MVTNGTRFYVLLCAIVLVTQFAVGAAPSYAGYDRPTPGIPDKYGVIYDTPIYDPGSKRYFELVWAHNPQDVYHGTKWAKALNDAANLEYKGVKGRLAIVDSIDVHEFLQRTFHPDFEVWIGMRYWCVARRLQTSDGKFVQHPLFQAWDVNWKQDIYACNNRVGNANDEYMPVAYSPASKGFRWIGKGMQKEFFGYFVEFPTGKP